MGEGSDPYAARGAENQTSAVPIAKKFSTGAIESRKEIEVWVKAAGNYCDGVCI